MMCYFENLDLRGYSDVPINTFRKENVAGKMYRTAKYANSYRRLLPRVICLVLLLIISDIYYFYCCIMLLIILLCYGLLFYFFKIKNSLLDHDLQTFSESAETVKLLWKHLKSINCKVFKYFHPSTYVRVKLRNKSRCVVYSCVNRATERVENHHDKLLFRLTVTSWAEGERRERLDDSGSPANGALCHSDYNKVPRTDAEQLHTTDRPYSRQVH